MWLKFCNSPYNVYGWDIMRCELESLSSYTQLRNCYYLFFYTRHCSLFHYTALSVCLGLCSWSHHLRNLHPLCACKQFEYWSPCYILRNCCLPHPYVLLYRKNTHGLQYRVNLGPLPSSTVALLCHNPRNLSSNSVMKYF